MHCKGVRDGLFVSMHSKEDRKEAPSTRPEASGLRSGSASWPDAELRADFSQVCILKNLGSVNRGQWLIAGAEQTVMRAALTPYSTILVSYVNRKMLKRGGCKV